MSKYTLSIAPDDKTPIETGFADFYKLPEILEEFIKGFTGGESPYHKVSFMLEEVGTGRSQLVEASYEALENIPTIGGEVVRQLVKGFTN